MILSPSTVIEMYVFFGLKCSPRHLFSPNLCCYDARGRYRSSDTHISSCQVQNYSGVPGVPSNYSGVPGLECIDFCAEFPDFFGVPGVLGVLRNFSEVLRNTWSALSAEKLFRSARSAQEFHRSARTAVLPGIPRNFSRVPGVPRNFSGVS